MLSALLCERINAHQAERRGGCANRPSVQLSAGKCPHGATAPLGLWLQLNQGSRGLGNRAAPGLWAHRWSEPRQMFGHKEKVITECDEVVASISHWQYEKSWGWHREKLELAPRRLGLALGKAF